MLDSGHREIIDLLKPQKSLKETIENLLTASAYYRSSHTRPFSKMFTQHFLTLIIALENTINPCAESDI